MIYEMVKNKVLNVYKNWFDGFDIICVKNRLWNPLRKGMYNPLPKNVPFTCFSFRKLYKIKFLANITNLKLFGQNSLGKHIYYFGLNIPKNQTWNSLAERLLKIIGHKKILRFLYNIGLKLLKILSKRDLSQFLEVLVLNFNDNTHENLFYRLLWNCTVN